MWGCTKADKTACVPLLCKSGRGKAAANGGAPRAGVDCQASSDREYLHEDEEGRLVRQTTDWLNLYLVSVDLPWYNIEG